MPEKIKRYLNWEFILFIFINLVILVNIFIYLDFYFAEFMANIINTTSGDPIKGPGFFVGMVGIGLLLIPLFVIIKYLSLPMAVWTIHKYSKKEEIKNLITIIIKNTNLKIMIILLALIADITVFFISYIMRGSYRDYYFSNNLFLYLIFGGLTGSYLVLFIFSFIYNKFRNRSKSKEYDELVG